MKKVSEYKGDTLYQDPATGELWEMDEGEKTYCWSSVEAWKNAIDWDEQMRADAHSCSANAVFSDKGPAGAVPSAERRSKALVTKILEP